MFFQRIKTPGIAHVSYMLGNEAEVAVVDPRRDVDEYLAIASDQGLAIKYIVETHRQEDFVMGSTELARITGAQVVNGRHALFGRGDVRLADGQDIELAGLRLRALSTPGHTPESMSYAVFLPDAPNTAWGVLTGDALFIGEAGRTDLPDRKKTAENAGILYDAIHEKILPLGDQALVLPAHGSGSVCGGNIAQRDDSTLGVERAYNPVFTQTRAEFIAAKLAERIPRPPHFALMEQLNLKGGIALASRPCETRLLQAAQFQAESGQGLVIDTREPEAFAGGHMPASYNIWLAGLPIFGGWVAASSANVYLVLGAMSDLESAVMALARIGIDRIAGVLAGGFPTWHDAGLPVARSGTIDARSTELQLDKLRVLDVREDGQFEAGHIPNSTHLYVGYLEQHLAELEPPLDKAQPIVVTCSVGHRAGLAASILRRLGYLHVDNLLGGIKAWSKLELPTERGAQHSITTPDIEGARS